MVKNGNVFLNVFWEQLVKMEIFLVVVWWQLLDIGYLMVLVFFVIIRFVNCFILLVFVVDIFVQIVFGLILFRMLFGFLIIMVQVVGLGRQVIIMLQVLVRCFGLCLVLVFCVMNVVIRFWFKFSIVNLNLLCRMLLVSLLLILFRLINLICIFDFIVIERNVFQLYYC